MAEEPPGLRGGPTNQSIFFLSDYGLQDEFVGVVHAVLAKEAPGVFVIDLTHAVPAFDVAAGSLALRRAAPFLGPGVVLAVVDPGVGSARRGVAVEVADEGGPRFFVGPDNGLLHPVLRHKVIVGAVSLEIRHGESVTFDGRDVFAPACARLATGHRLADLGSPLEVDELVALPEPHVELSATGDAASLEAEVTWVDRFGNVQLAAAAEALEAAAPELLSGAGVSLVGDRRCGATLEARRVRSFSELGPGELGLVVDGNGHLALVLREGSAARHLGLRPGDRVALAWPRR